MRKWMLYLVPAVLTAVPGFAQPKPAAPEKVFVVNFPEQQEVSGSVNVEGHLETARLFSFEAVVVPPASPDNPARMVQLGTLDAAGFRSVVASLAGTFPQIAGRGGTVGVLLVPDASLFLEALTERGLPLLAHRTEATVDPARPPFFASPSDRFALAFPRYRIFLYNTGEKAVEANLYLYVTD